MSKGFTTTINGVIPESDDIIDGDGFVVRSEFPGLCLGLSMRDLRKRTLEGDSFYWGASSPPNGKAGQKLTLEDIEKLRKKFEGKQ